MTVTGLPTLFTEHEAARTLGVSIDTMRRVRRRGEIGYRIIARRPKYTAEDLRRYIDEQAVEPCQSEINGSAESADTASPARQSRRTGKSPGLTRVVGNADAAALARQTFTKPR